MNDCEHTWDQPRHCVVSNRWHRVTMRFTCCEEHYTSMTNAQIAEEIYGMDTPELVAWFLSRLVAGDMRPNGFGL